MHSYFSIPNFDCGKNVIVFGVDISPSVYIDKKKKDILILCKDSTQGLNDTQLTAEAQYSINFSRSNRKFCLSLHYKGSNSLFVNVTKTYQFKAKDFEIKKISFMFRKYSRRFFS